MNERIAENLVRELWYHAGVATVDRALFLGVLLDADVPQASSRFYETLPDVQQLIQESGCYHFLSLRRVLRNYNAERYRLSGPKQAYEAVASAIGIYDSDALSRNLRADGALIELMSKSRHPFSLLGKLETYDHDNPEEDLFVVTKPVLLIPDASDTRIAIEKICAWKDANTTYEKEFSATLIFPIPHRKRISRQEYLESGKEKEQLPQRAR